MKKVLFLSAIAAMAMASCSNDQVFDQPQNDGDYITLRAAGGTRGIAVGDATGLQATTFRAVGLEPDGNAYLDATVSYTTEWTYDNKKAWPTAALDFYAVNPATHNNLSAVTFNLTDKKFTYEVPVAVADQVDVMYSVKKAQRKSNRTVDFLFKHALAQVAFKATTTDAKFTAEINGIEVCNLVNKGTFTYPNENTVAGEASNGTWSNEATVADFAIATVGKAPVTVGNASKEVSAADGMLMILPQTTTKWATTKEKAVTIEDANKNKQCYLKIQLKLKENNSYIVGSADDFATVYMPFGYEWQMGKKYIYNLKFGNGAGYDDEGNPVLQFIEFNPDVEAWIEEKVVDIDM